VAAGRPIESSFHQEFFEVPRAMLKKQGDYFALKVEGDSMVDEGIFDGDFLIVKKQVDAENGQIVVAYVEGGATVKKFFNKKNHIELHPANPKYSVMRVEAEKDFRIEGLLCGVLRVFSD
jgi:repressor LexA